MKPVLICLFLIGFSLAGSVSASGNASDYDWYGLLIEANPYAGCPAVSSPTIMMAFSIPIPTPDVLSASLHAMMSGLLDPIPSQGAPPVSSPMMMTGSLTQSLRRVPHLFFHIRHRYRIRPELPGQSCPTCGTTQSSLKTGYSSLSISSNNAPGSTLYSFANGTPIPADYVCPIHGIYCPDDPRPIEDRPGYADIVSYEKPAMVSRTLPETTAEFMELFTTAVSIPKSGRMDGILYRSR